MQIPNFDTWTDKEIEELYADAKRALEARQAQRRLEREKLFPSEEWHEKEALRYLEYIVGMRDDWGPYTSYISKHFCMREHEEDLLHKIERGQHLEMQKGRTPVVGSWNSSACLSVEEAQNGLIDSVVEMFRQAIPELPAQPEPTLGTVLVITICLDRHSQWETKEGDFKSTLSLTAQWGRRRKQGSTD